MFNVIALVNRIISAVGALTKWITKIGNKRKVKKEEKNLKKHTKAVEKAEKVKGKKGKSKDKKKALDDIIESMK